MDSKRTVTYSESFTLDAQYIRSAVGAGDAFCSGILYSLHEGLEIKQAIDLANACARFNLFDATATGGAQPLSTVIDFLSKNNK